MRFWLSTFLGVLVFLGLTAIWLGPPVLASIWVGPWAAFLYVVAFPGYIASLAALLDRYLNG